MAERLEGKTEIVVGGARGIGAAPLKRLALPVEVGDAMAFLASGQAAYITGQMLVLDGGQTLLEARL